MHVRFWGTRGSIPTPGRRTAIYGGNTSCVEIRTDDGTLIILDSGTGIRELGLDLLRSRPGPHRIYLLIGHTHWDHIQGFPFFTPAFIPGTELNIYAPSGFQRSLEEALSGQMQYSYFPVKLNDLASRIHFTELEEGFFRIGDILVETQYINHTAPTIAYRITSGGATVAYVTDHEPFWNSADSNFQHPGEQRQLSFLRGADLVIHDAQYTCEEYKTKLGWGHSTIQYSTDVAMAAGVAKLALFHHDPTHDDDTVKALEAEAQQRAKEAGSSLEIFAAAEGLELEVIGRGATPAVAEISALDRRSIAGSRVLLVTDRDADVRAIEEVLVEDGLVLSPVPSGRAALDRAAALVPDLVIMSADLSDGSALDFIDPLRLRAGRSDLPILLLSQDQGSVGQLSMSASATDYLATPFSPPMLRTRVRAWLARMAIASTVPEELPPARSTPVIEGASKVNLDYLEILSTVPLFRALSREKLESVLTRATAHTFPAGHMIIRQGEPARLVYIIINGRVRVVEAVPDSPIEMFLDELGMGEVFGELGILRERPRSASVFTLEKTVCLKITEADFVKTLKDSPDMSFELLRVLAGRLYDADRLLARHAPDPLTGLPGRRAFHELYRRLTASARRRKVSVMLIALDVIHLKDINDRFGNNVGDEVLRTVADALLDSSRSTDLVSRYGSDEFAVLLVEAGANDAAVILGRVEGKLQDMATLRKLPLRIECNIGYTVTQTPPETADELLRAADLDMQSKRKVQRQPF
jgi:diguanylate cyclase (GGDEF)-like protein